ncbi:MAG: glycosyltransferase family 2 protein [Deltaproteobacteria bacterium]|nr:glycosyltransferase family 2 protein [Deltaproteobacteria bacterium]
MAENVPLVSIVIPTFNRAGLLKSAIESCLRQTYGNVQIVVSDDGSTDGTDQMMNEYMSKFRSVVFAKNSKYRKGPNGNRNSGFDGAAGDFICLIDDDDELMPEAVAEMINAHNKTGKRYMISNCATADGKWTGFGLEGDCEITYLDAVCGRFYGDFFVMFHRDLLGEMRFDDRTYGGEYALWGRLLRKENGWYTAKPLQLKRYGDSGVTAGYYQHADGVLLAYEAILSDFGGDIKRHDPERLTRLMSIASLYAKLCGEHRKAFSYLLESLRFDKSAGRSYATLLLLFMPAGLVKRLINIKTIY